jgi:Zn-dependent peptidase ImmA (M78 family)
MTGWDWRLRVSDFSVDDGKITYISGQFHVERRHVEDVHQIFSNVIGRVKNQYLAHIIRCMESYVRQKTGNPMFQINTFPIDSESPVLNVGCAQYYPKRYFSIFFHPSMDEKQLRVCLSHELGHLFIIEMLNEAKDDETGTFDKTTLTEPLSSIFGVFTMMDKNLFYEEAATRFNHHSAKDLIQEFVHLQNKLVN